MSRHPFEPLCQLSSRSEIGESEADPGQPREGWPRGRHCGHQPPPLSECQFTASDVQWDGNKPHSIGFLRAECAGDFARTR